MTLFFYWLTLMRRFSWACMPNFVVLGCLEVGEKFSVVGGGWWVAGAFRHQLQSYTNLSCVDVELGCNNRFQNMYKICWTPFPPTPLWFNMTQKWPKPPKNIFLENSWKLPLDLSKTLYFMKMIMILYVDVLSSHTVVSKWRHFEEKWCFIIFHKGKFPVLKKYRLISF